MEEMLTQTGRADSVYLLEPFHQKSLVPCGVLLHDAIRYDSMEGAALKKTTHIVSVSGGPDSVYLVRRAVEGKCNLILAHFNHRARGKASSADRKFVESLSEELGIPLEVREALLRRGSGTSDSGRKGMKAPPGFEERARAARYVFLMEQKKAHGAGKILVGHTADDQVETVLMRFLEGAGISGLKGIPRKSRDGIERPILDIWREDILKYLRKHKIPFQVDRSNFDTRFERNWIRHVLIPLLEKRYGKAVKHRIFVLGERFREIDEFLETAARRWMKRNVNQGSTGKNGSARERATDAGRLRFHRKPYRALLSALRKKILQVLCFERIGIAPNERLLDSIDRILVSGGPSARLNIGKGAVLRRRYDQGIFEILPADGRSTAKKGVASRSSLPAEILWEEKGRLPAAGLRRFASGERAAVFDADKVELPIRIRPLEAGDRVRPFGMDAEKKVKEILIDRKIPREERWGRPVVCDGNGTILWIPGVVRSAHAPVTASTCRTAFLRVRLPNAKKGKGSLIVEGR